MWVKGSFKGIRPGYSDFKMKTRIKELYDSPSLSSWDVARFSQVHWTKNTKRKEKTFLLEHGMLQFFIDLLKDER